MICQNCGQEIADGSIICSFCGKTLTTAAEQPESTENTENKEPVSGESESMEAVSGDSESTETDTGASESEDTVTGASESPDTIFGGPESSDAGGETPAPASKKRSGVKIILAVILALLAVLVVLVILNRAVLVNMFHRIFDTPEKYLQYVLGRNIDRTADDLADAYDSWLQQGKLLSQGYDVTVSFELDDAGRDLLSLASDGRTDADWFESGAFHGIYSLSDEGNVVEGDMNLNGVTLLSFVSLANFDEMMLAAQIPELMEEYIATDLDDNSMAEKIAELRNDTGYIYEALPDKKQIRTLFARYGKLIVGCIDDVEKESDNLTAEGVSQNCTVLRYTVDYDMIVAAAEKILDTIEDDEDLEAVLRRFCEAAGEAYESGRDDAAPDSDEIYENMMDGIVNGLEKIVSDPERDEMKAAIDCELYVGSDGEIAGIIATAKGTNGQEAVVKYAEPRNGASIGYEFSMDSGEYNITLSGSGTSRGGKVTGDFVFDVMGTEYVEIGVTDLDTAAMRKGNFSGGLHIEPGTGLNRLLGHSSLTSSFTRSSLDLQLDVSAKKQQVEIAANDREDRLFTLSWTIQAGKEKRPEIPDNIIEDQEEIREVLEDEDLLEEMIDRFEEAGIPEEFIENWRYDPSLISSLYEMIASLAMGYIPSR